MPKPLVEVVKPPPIADRHRIFTTSRNECLPCLVVVPSNRRVRFLLRHCTKQRNPAAHIHLSKTRHTWCHHANMISREFRTEVLRRNFPKCGKFHLVKDSSVYWAKNAPLLKSWPGFQKQKHVFNHSHREFFRIKSSGTPEKKPRNTSEGCVKSPGYLGVGTNNKKLVPETKKCRVPSFCGNFSKNFTHPLGKKNLFQGITVMVSEGLKLQSRKLNMY